MRTGSLASRFSSQFSLLILGTFVFTSLCASGQQSRLTDNAQTSAKKPSRNFVASQSLEVLGGSDRVFVKFSLPENLPPGTIGAHVGKATLKLFVNGVNNPGLLGVAGVTSAWSESTITDATAPSIGSLIGSTTINAAQQDQWITFDVTSIVQGWINDAGSNNGIVLFAAAGGADVVFDSKENQNTSHQPQLEIVLNHAATADNATNAANAANATELGGVPAGNFSLKSDPVAAGSPNYIQNTTVQQPLSNFNISGNGTIGGTLSANTLSLNIVNANTQFNLGGVHILSAAGFQNTFLGTSAGLKNSSSFNSFFGALAGTENTTGIANSFFGDTAGQKNTTGSRNSSFGSGAGFINDTGSDNSMFGYHAGVVSAGSANSFLGSNAGLSNTTGVANTFVGAEAGESNTTGTNNNFFGETAGALNTTGSANDFFGIRAGLLNTTGALNSFFGEETGLSNTEGQRNSFFGNSAGFTNSTGADNTALGAHADVGSGSLNFATAIGAGAVVSSSNTIVLGRSGGQDTVQVPGTLSVNTLSANVLNAGTQFDLGGSHVLSDAGFQNIFVGNQAGLQNSGAFNTFVGSLAGKFNTGGAANSFFGDTAGENNTTGSENSSFGSEAGFGNQTGTANSLFGYHSGVISTGSFNSFFGRETGANNTIGHDNTFFGDQAGFSNTEGVENTFIGDAAGYFNTTAGQNSFFGRSAGQQNTTGHQNTFVGYFAGFSNTNAEGNSFLGYQAGASTTTGIHNGFFGWLAGGENTTGQLNNFFGAFAGRSVSTGSNNAYFGDFAGGDNLIGDSNTIVGAFAGHKDSGIPTLTNPGSGNTFVGVSSGQSNVTGNQNTLLGEATDVGANNLTFATAIGAGSVVSTSNSITLGRNTGLDTVQIPGFTGIGTLTPASPLTVVGIIETDSAAGGIKFPDGSIQKSAAAISGNVVKSLNGLVGDVVLTPGSPNVIITQVGNNVSIAAHADATAILNQTTLQSPANFNIDGTGTVGMLFAPKFVASADYREAGGDTSILNDFGGNLRVGPNAGIGPTGSLNTYVGSDAGSNSVAPGDQNSFFGYHSGQGATSGDGGNTFAGAFSGPLNHGDNNSYFGRNTGLSNDTGSNNTLIGANANVTATGLSNATAIGAGATVAASDSLVLGNNVNVGIGTSLPTSRLTVAGFVESTTGGVKFPDGSIQTTAAAGAGPFVRSVNGLNNDVVLAAGSNVTITPAGNTLTISAAGGGSSGSAILNQLGLQSPANFNINGTGKAGIFDALTQYNLAGAKVLSIPGQDNLFVGAGTGSVPDPSGDNIENVFVGTQSGPRTTECCNAFFGNYTGKNNTTGQVNTFLGYQAGVANVQGSNNTFVGSNAGALHTAGDGNTFIGDIAGAADLTGLNNTFVGRGTGGESALTGPHPGTPGAYNTFLGTNATATQPANLTYATAIGAGSVVDDNNKIVLGRSTDLISVPGTFTNPSDIRLKSRIANLNYGLNEVLHLRPVSWTWKNDPTERIQMGLIAQEVRPLVPEVVLEGSGKDHLLSMNYIGLLPIVIRAIQEQQQTIDDLRQQLAKRKLLGVPAISQTSLKSVSQKTTVIDGTSAPISTAKRKFHYPQDSIALTATSAINSRSWASSLKRSSPLKSTTTASPLRPTNRT